MSATLLAAGTALQIYGQYKANKAEAQAEMENAAWLEEQALFAEESAERAASIFERESDILVGEQLGGFAKAGVEMSGSALDVIGESRALASKELQAIERAGKMQVREALLKSGAAKSRAASLTDPMNQFMQAAGPALSAAGTYQANKSKGKK